MTNEWDDPTSEKALSIPDPAGFMEAMTLGVVGKLDELEVCDVASKWFCQECRLSSRAHPDRSAKKLKSDWVVHLQL